MEPVCLHEMSARPLAKTFFLALLVYNAFYVSNLSTTALADIQIATATRPHLQPQVLSHLASLRDGHIMLVGCTFSYLLMKFHRLSASFRSDNAHGRVLPFAFGGSTTNTVESCINSCIAKGYKIAGMEYSGTKAFHSLCAKL